MAAVLAPAILHLLRVPSLLEAAASAVVKESRTTTPLPRDGEPA